MRQRAVGLSFILILAMVAMPMMATTWALVEKKCPVCGKKAQHMQVTSWGSYIYSWPSKYQNIFWPKTDSKFLHYCLKCHYAAFMWDFEDLPKDKVQAAKKALEGVKVDQAKDDIAVPMVTRLELAEKVYGVLDKSDEFWCEFYRVKGYWLEEERRDEESTVARKRALDLALKMAADPNRAGVLKNLYLTIGAMRYFTGDPEGALADFKKALPMEYKSADNTEEQNTDMQEYLNKLLADYINRLEKKEYVPRG